MAIEYDFDVAFVAGQALREKQIQQNYRPYVAVHKWFARRPGSLFRSLVLAEFGRGDLREEYYKPHDFSGKLVVDPFMGGGTPILEANRVGCDVLGFDVNPMAVWVCREELEHLDLATYTEEATRLRSALNEQVGDLYLTDCPAYGERDVPVKSFLWVKVRECEHCGREVDFFPGFLVAENKRHPRNVLICASCGDLNEAEDRNALGRCRTCNEQLTLEGPATRGRCPCKHCGHINRIARDDLGPPRHRLFALEYYNPARKAQHRGRFFKRPDAKDLARVAEAGRRWEAVEARFVPDDPIIAGDETDRLHRWGYDAYRQMFNARQLLGLEASAGLISSVEDQRVRHALATNLSDLLRYQNMLCRYDTMALKALDIFSVHGFPVGLVQCESNLLGIVNGGGLNVGSGGWSNVIEKYRRAKEYCDSPFEVELGAKGKKTQRSVPGEWIGECRQGSKPRVVEIRCATSTAVELEPGSADAVLTDPPYFGMVQYGELMEFCYVWLRRLAATDSEGFGSPTARSDAELTGNTTEGRDLGHFTDGLAEVYSRMAMALKPNAPLAFTFHHNKLEAYAAVVVALLDSGLTCSASLPCPAEMAGSIHISGTGSSIVDTVFVCRSSGSTRSEWLFTSSAELATIVERDLELLTEGGMRPSTGDLRCVTFGHLARMAIWNLRSGWDRQRAVDEKLALALSEMNRLGSLTEVASMLEPTPKVASLPLFRAGALTEVANAVAF